MIGLLVMSFCPAWLFLYKYRTDGKESGAGDAGKAVCKLNTEQRRMVWMADWLPGETPGQERALP